uniref:Uncharacterized protein n=1 Tax=mine drainage metagenome TaxID=410659 RepID=E6QUW1_9ZZZZ
MMKTYVKLSGKLAPEYFNEKSLCTKTGCGNQRHATSRLCYQHENRELAVAVAAVFFTTVSVAAAVFLETL